MKSREQEICTRLHRVDKSLTKLRLVEVEGLTTESTLSEQCKSLEREIERIKEQLAKEESTAQDLNTDIELELNKSSDSDEIGEVTSELVMMMEEKHKAIGNEIEHQ
ncbi:unnamed protein product [Calypogeia fissa]